MPTILHILTRPDDALAQDIIRLQQDAEQKIVVVDLTQPKPDYKSILLDIFAADSVQVW
jgi:hypothetical protein